MPRGGAREGAGKKNTWKSGSKFNETKVIRVPTKIADRVLELAHDLDSGIDYELETKSLKQENKKLKENQFKQLSLDFSNSFDEYKLTKLRDQALQRYIKAGSQSAKYKECKKAIDYIINELKKS